MMRTDRAGYVWAIATLHGRLCASRVLTISAAAQHRVRGEMAVTIPLPYMRARVHERVRGDIFARCSHDLEQRNRSNRMLIFGAAYDIALYRSKSESAG